MSIEHCKSTYQHFSAPVMQYQKRQQVADEYRIEAEQFIIKYNKLKREYFDQKDYLVVKYSDGLTYKHIHQANEYSQVIQVSLLFLTCIQNSILTLHFNTMCNRLIDKEITDICNDFKGHGEQCHVFCERFSPSRVKIPITCVLGDYCFDVTFEACVGNYWKQQEIKKWLLYVLTLPMNDNIMQRALYIILRSVRMVRQLRVSALFFLSVIFPLRWLSTQTHMLAHRKWGERHMASVIDCVYKWCQEIKERPSLIIQKSFMMSIFSQLDRKRCPN